MAAPGKVDVQAGLDVGKKEHFADVLDNDGERLFARAVANNQADLETLLDRAARHGTPGLAPVTRQSGTSLNAETRSRSHGLKNAMFPAAFASLRDPASNAFYDRKRAGGKRRNAALICLARRHVILAMLRTGQAGRPAPGLAEAA